MSVPELDAAAAHCDNEVAAARQRQAQLLGSLHRQPVRASGDQQSSREARGQRRGPSLRPDPGDDDEQREQQCHRTADGRAEKMVRRGGRELTAASGPEAASGGEHPDEHTGEDDQQDRPAAQVVPHHDVNADGGAPVPPMLR